VAVTIDREHVIDVIFRFLPHNDVTSRSDAILVLDGLEGSGYVLLSKDDPRLELDRLREWKESAIAVMNEWERVWEAAGRPGKLGGSKAASVQAFLEQL
jgi:hypothetical protein